MNRRNEPPSWLLNTVDRASRSYGWTRAKKAAVAALLAMGAWFATFAALAVTTGLGSVPTIACIAVGAAGLLADHIAGRRANNQDGTP